MAWNLEKCATRCELVCWIYATETASVLDIRSDPDTSHILITAARLDRMCNLVDLGAMTKPDRHELMAHPPKLREGSGRYAAATVN